MELVKIIGVAFVTVVCSLIIKNVKPELSFAVTTAGVLIIVLQSLTTLTNVVGVFSEFSKLAEIDNGLIKILLKMVSIGYLTELAVGVLNDLGGGSLADKVIVGGKLTILLISMPILQSLLEMMKNLLSKI